MVFGELYGKNILTYFKLYIDYNFPNNYGKPKEEIISEINCKAEMTKEQFEALGTANPYLDEYAFRLGTEVYVTQ